MKRLILFASLFLFCLNLIPGQSALKVSAVSITVSNLEQASKFYREVLNFQPDGEYTLSAEATRQLFGLPADKNPELRVLRLKLGTEYIELLEFKNAGKARGIPADSRSNDAWFQHIAIVVSDMDAAYKWLRQNKVVHVSSSPQKLPDYLPNAAGISAFYFRDPDGHNLEIIHFPKDKGNPKWQSPIPNPQSPLSLFLGIDHTAIGIEDTDAGLKFYRDDLGLAIGGASENYGTEQERLNQVFGAHLLITGLHAQEGYGVEFLDYLAPPGGRAYPADSRATDLWHWHTAIAVQDVDQMYKQLKTKGYTVISKGVVELQNAGLPFQKAFLMRDPDGHAVMVGQSAGSN
jgi:catechol 2,3-dioxygenase-like lactoylglutathione lyase family enzyme